MKNLKLIAGVSALSIGILSGNFSAFAEETSQVPAKDQALTENYTVNIEDIHSDIEFPEANNTMKAASFNVVNVPMVKIVDLAKGTSSLSSKDGKIKAAGKTKGLRLTTTTSVTNSIKNHDSGKIIAGKKSMAISKFSCNSSSSMKKTKKKHKYSSLSIHTATNQGVLYSKKTVKFGEY